MPLCSRCKKLKLGSDFYSYQTGAGRIQIKNPCIECAKQDTRISKTRRRRLTLKCVGVNVEIARQSSGSGLAEHLRADPSPNNP